MIYKNLSNLGGGLSEAETISTIDTALAETNKVIYIETDGNDTSGDGSRLKPFATLSKAYTIAKTLSPTASSPVQIKIGVGTFITPAISLDTAYINIFGSGRATRLAQTGMITQSAIGVISSLTFAYSSGTFDALYSDTAYIEGIILENVYFEHTTGTAISSFHNRLTNFYIVAATGISNAVAANICNGILEVTVLGIRCTGDGNGLLWATMMSALDIRLRGSETIGIHGVKVAGSRHSQLKASRIHGEDTGGTNTIGVSGVNVSIYGCTFSCHRNLVNYSEGICIGSLLESDAGHCIDGLDASAALSSCYIVQQGGGLYNINGTIAHTVFEGDGTNDSIALSQHYGNLLACSRFVGGTAWGVGDSFFGWVAHHPGSITIDGSGTTAYTPSNGLVTGNSWVEIGCDFQHTGTGQFSVAGKEMCLLSQGDDWQGNGDDIPAGGYGWQLGVAGYSGGASSGNKIYFQCGMGTGLDGDEINVGNALSLNATVGININFDILSGVHEARIRYDINENTYKMFLDGNFIKEASGTVLPWTAGPALLSGHPIRIGRRIGFAGEGVQDCYFSGKIGNIMIKTVKTEEDTQPIFNGAIWKFYEGSGSEAKDEFNEFPIYLEGNYIWTGQLIR
jgi:hypothetical protein